MYLKVFGRNRVYEIFDNVKNVRMSGNRWVNIDDVDIKTNWDWVRAHRDDEEFKNQKKSAYDLAIDSEHFNRLRKFAKKYFSGHNFYYDGVDDKGGISTCRIRIFSSSEDDISKSTPGSTSKYKMAIYTKNGSDQIVLSRYPIYLCNEEGNTLEVA